MRQKLEKELDRVVRGIVLKRDLNCITCDCGLNTWNATPGHFIKRRHRCTRWDLRNVNGQCLECNVEDNDARYHDAMLRRYSAAVIGELTRLAHQDCKYSEADLRNLLNNLSNGRIDAC